jgi:MFS family permease
MGWSAGALSGAFALMLLMSGFLGIVVGRLTDRYGARVVMSAGSVLGAAGLALFSVVQDLWLVYLAWGGVISAAAAATFYLPAFTAVTSWFERKRGKALGVLTLLGGFASIIFIPLTSQLIDAFGWRVTARLLALIILLVALPLHALVLRRRPEDLGLRRDGVESALEDSPETIDSPATESDPQTSRVWSGMFLVLTAGFFFSFLAAGTVIVHQIPHLIDSGFGATKVATAVGFVGIASLPGRFILSSLSDRVDPTVIFSSILVLMGSSIFVLIWASGLAVVYLYVLLFGLGFGALQPLRAAIMAKRVGPANYGTVLGMQGAIIAVSMALGPLLAGVLRDITGTYDLAFVLMAASLFLAAVLSLASASWRPRSVPA